MFKYFKKKQSIEDKLYNKILSLSRNKLFYTRLGLSDTFQNRIIIIFLHISFLFNKIKKNEDNSFYFTLNTNNKTSVAIICNNNNSYYVRKAIETYKNTSLAPSDK